MALRDYTKRALIGLAALGLTYGSVGTYVAHQDLKSKKDAYERIEAVNNAHWSLSPFYNGLYSLDSNGIWDLYSDKSDKVDPKPAQNSPTPMSEVPAPKAQAISTPAYQVKIGDTDATIFAKSNQDVVNSAYVFARHGVEKGQDLLNQYAAGQIERKALGLSEQYDKQAGKILTDLAKGKTSVTSVYKNKSAEPTWLLQSNTSGTTITQTPANTLQNSYNALDNLIANDVNLNSALSSGLYQDDSHSPIHYSADVVNSAQSRLNALKQRISQNGIRGLSLADLQRGINDMYRSHDTPYTTCDVKGSFGSDYSLYGALVNQRDALRGASSQKRTTISAQTSGKAAQNVAPSQISYQQQVQAPTQKRGLFTRMFGNNSTSTTKSPHELRYIQPTDDLGLKRSFDGKYAVAVQHEKKGIWPFRKNVTRIVATESPLDTDIRIDRRGNFRYNEYDFTENGHLLNAGSFGGGILAGSALSCTPAGQAAAIGAATQYGVAKVSERVKDPYVYALTQDQLRAWVPILQQYYGDKSSASVANFVVQAPTHRDTGKGSTNLTNAVAIEVSEGKKGRYKSVTPKAGEMRWNKTGGAAFVDAGTLFGHGVAIGYLTSEISGCDKSKPDTPKRQPRGGGGRDAGSGGTPSTGTPTTPNPQPTAVYREAGVGGVPSTTTTSTGAGSSIGGSGGTTTYYYDVGGM
jgi:hypothetical protein